MKFEFRVLSINIFLSVIFLMSLGGAAFAQSTNQSTQESEQGEEVQPAIDSSASDSSGADEAADDEVSGAQTGAADAEFKEDQESRDEAGWEIYQDALDKLAIGDEAGALQSLETLAAQYPDHPATGRSEKTRSRLRVRLDLAEEDGAGDEPAEAETVASEKTDQDTDQSEQSDQSEQGARIPAGLREEISSTARAEFVSFQTLHGIIFGLEICAWTECDSPASLFGSAMLGGGAGLGLSLLVSSDGVTPGFANLIDSSALWGGYHGLLLFGISNPDSTSNHFGSIAVGQLAGMGLGALLWTQLHPVAGEVSMANSMGGWLSTYAFLGHAAGNFRSSTESVLTTMLIAADVGLVGGALASQVLPMSRSRLMIIDSGGILGMITGLGLYVVAFDSDNLDSPSGPMLSAMFGSMVGLGLTTYLTRHWDVPDIGVDARLQLLPTEEGATVGFTGTF